VRRGDRASVAVDEGGNASAGFGFHSGRPGNPKQQVQPSFTFMVICAVKTVLPSVSVTTTGTTLSPSLLQSTPSPLATAVRSVFALARYSTGMPLGIQRAPAGIDTLVIMPAASSAALHMAIACTVPRWLVTSLAKGSRTMQLLTSNSDMSGLMVLKYGAIWHAILLKAAGPAD